MEKIKNFIYVSDEEIKELFEGDMSVPIKLVENAFTSRYNGDVLMPDKISQVFDEKTQNRINCMPATLLNEKVCGVKWVSVFPNNPKVGISNVQGTVILSEIEHGRTIAIMDAGVLTDIRTAAVGATAAKYLAKKGAKVIGLIGSGNQAQRHLELIKIACPDIQKCYISSRSADSTKKFIENEKAKNPDIEFIDCKNDYEKAVINADIIVTAISGQEDVLKAKWIKKGALYIHVGGWEDEFAVAQKANKIVCDEWECVKHRSQTLCRMYKEGLLTDNDIYANIGQIITGNKPGRENNEEFIYFNSVGMAYIDVTFAKYIYDKYSK